MPASTTQSRHDEKNYKISRHDPRHLTAKGMNCPTPRTAVEKSVCHPTMLSSVQLSALPPHHDSPEPRHKISPSRPLDDCPVVVDKPNQCSRLNTGLYGPQNTPPDNLILDMNDGDKRCSIWSLPLQGTNRENILSLKTCRRRLGNVPQSTEEPEQTKNTSHQEKPSNSAHCDISGLPIPPLPSDFGLLSDSESVHMELTDDSSGTMLKNFKRHPRYSEDPAKEDNSHSVCRSPNVLPAQSRLKRKRTCNNGLDTEHAKSRVMHFNHGERESVQKIYIPSCLNDIHPNKFNNFDSGIQPDQGTDNVQRPSESRLREPHRTSQHNVDVVRISATPIKSNISTKSKDSDLNIEVCETFESQKRFQTDNARLQLEKKDLGKIRSATSMMITTQKAFDDISNRGEVGSVKLPSQSHEKMKISPLRLGSDERLRVHQQSGRNHFLKNRAIKDAQLCLLSNEDLMELQTSLDNIQEHGQPIFIKGTNIALNNRDFVGLLSDKPLNDEVMNSFVTLINSRNELHHKANAWKSKCVPSDESVQALCRGCDKSYDYWRRFSLSRARMYMFNSFFFSKLTQGGSYEYRGVQRWLDRAGRCISDLDLILIPINLDNCRWVLAAIDIQNRQLLYFDSMMERERKNAFDVLKRWLQDEVANKVNSKVAHMMNIKCWRTIVNPSYMPELRVSGSCGIVTVYLAEYLERGKVPDFTSNDILTLRQRATLYLLRGKLPEN